MTKLMNGGEWDFANVPDVDGLSVAFGSTDFLPAYGRLPEEFQKERHPFCKHASSLFFGGGSLTPEGHRLKAGLDRGKVSACIQAHLCSFEPHHEHKIAGVGFMFAQWFEVAA